MYSTSTCTDPPAGKSPSAQGIAVQPPPLTVPCSSSPFGKMSVSDTLRATLGPSLLTTMVYVCVVKSPAVTIATLSSTVVRTSARGLTTAIQTCAVSLLAIPSLTVNSKSTAPVNPKGGVYCATPEGVPNVGKNPKVPWFGKSGPMLDNVRSIALSTSVAPLLKSITVGPASLITIMGLPLQPIFGATGRSFTPVTASRMGAVEV